MRKRLTNLIFGKNLASFFIALSFVLFYSYVSATFAYANSVNELSPAENTEENNGDALPNFADAAAKSQNKLGTLESPAQKSEINYNRRYTYIRDAVKSSSLENSTTYSDLANKSEAINTQSTNISSPNHAGIESLDANEIQKPLDSKMLSTYQQLKKTSSEALIINAAVEKFHRDDIAEHLKPKFDEMNELLDSSIITFSKLYALYLNDKNADEKVKFIISNDINNNPEAFLPQRIRLEIDKQNFYISDVSYNMKKIEIRQLYIDKIVPPEKLKDITFLESSITFNCQESVDIKNDLWNMWKEWLPLISTIIFQFSTLVIAFGTLILGWLKNQREVKDSALLPLKETQLRQEIEVKEKNKKLNKSKKKK